MNHVIHISIIDPNEFKELVRKTIENYIKIKNWNEIPNYNSLLIEIRLNISQCKNLHQFCNEIYNIKFWLNEKYNRKVTLHFTET